MALNVVSINDRFEEYVFKVVSNKDSSDGFTPLIDRDNKRYKVSEFALVSDDKESKGYVLKMNSDGGGGGGSAEPRRAVVDMYGVKAVADGVAGDVHADE